MMHQVPEIDALVIDISDRLWRVVDAIRAVEGITEEEAGQAAESFRREIERQEDRHGRS